LDIIGEYDLVLDASDNFPTRYLINDACVLLRKPLVHGAVYMNEGQVAVFNMLQGSSYSSNYRDLHATPPSSNMIPDCSEAGVLGVLPGIIGTMQAAEAVKVLSGYGKPLINRVLYYNLLANSFYEIELQPRATSVKIPASLDEFGNTDYYSYCGDVETLSWDDALMKNRLRPNDAILIDVREFHEEPLLKDLEYLRIPLQHIADESGKYSSADTLILFCHNGIRSIRAARLLKSIMPEKKVYSIRGGISDLSSVNLQHNERQA
jgi:adenylyltransferase/sulfurtransferase